MNGTRISRRAFLAGTATATLGMSALAQPSQSAPLHVGVIGCGGEGTRLLRELARCGATVSSVYDVLEPRKRAAALRYASTAASEWVEIVAQRDVDAVLIATPTHLHVPIAIAAMEAGKHVFCAAPIALSLDDARAFRDCAVRTGRVVQIGAEPAAEGVWQTARGLIRAGIIGDITWCQGRFHTDTSVALREPSETDRIDWHAFHPQGSRDIKRLTHWQHYWDYSAGAVVESHFSELAGLLQAVDLEFPVRVSAAGGVYVEDGRETPDSFVMAAEYPSGATIVLASTKGSACATINGRAGSIELSNTQVRVIRETTDGPHSKVYYPPATSTLVKEWLNAIQAKRTGGATTVACDAERGYRAMVAVAMAVEAYRQKKTFRFDAARGIMLPDRPLSKLEA